VTALPSVTTLDLVKVQAQIERHLEKRSRVLDRSTQLAIAPAAREKSRSKADGSWAHNPMPSDPPIIQMLLYLSGELETGAWKNIEDDFKRCQMQNQITKQITDLINSLEDKSSSAFDELCTLINQQMRANEHADRMAAANKTSDDALSDDQITAKAKRLGITLNGDPA
jgi:hypothetical protein